MGNGHGFVERDMAGLVFCVDAGTLASKIHQNPAHHLGRDPEEVGPVLPAHVFPINEAEICFVD
jgi:hypothetical protein